MALRWKLSDRTLTLAEPLAAGIVNVTVDSMYEGARSGTPQQAVLDGVALAEQGFDLIDIGAVAARSGPPVPAAEEAARLAPAVAGLSAAVEQPISADTFSPAVAAAALDAGAVAINDIGGGGPEMFELVAERGCGYVLMHIEGLPRQDRRPPAYEDVVAHLVEWFGERIEQAVAAGVAEEQIVVDPGLDFDLSLADDVEILRRLPELHALGRPLYVSLSRKDFLGALVAGSWEQRVGADQREWATVAATTLAVAAGAQLLRLHDLSALQALRVAGRVCGGAADGATIGS
ncbi:MAG: dihydropteroate synthase [Solirubrobacterales bacterium]|nr:dihydropteroate synthase [Solirubrobacterales bacterium]